MTVETALPYSWLRNISPDIARLDKVPLWGNPPPFPWELFEKGIREALHMQELQISSKNTEWRPQDQLLKGLGQDPILHAFALTPLEGQAYWIFPHEDLKALLELTVEAEEALSTLSEERWQDEFYEFIALESIQVFEKVQGDLGLSIQLLRDVELPHNPCLCIDIEIKTPKKIFHGRLALTPEITKSLQKKYSAPSLKYPKGFAETIQTTVHLVAGHVELSQDQWKAATLGDFLILDSCSITPGDEKGRIVLTVNGSPLFRGKIKDGNIKILEYPLLHEVKTSMETEDEEFETEEETELEETELEETEEDVEQETLPDEETEEDQVEEEEEEIKKPLESPPSPLAKIEEIPLTISIEVGRIQMSLADLMSLVPGNLLELNIHPENGVDLVVGSRVVAKGELLKIGETLGVRILEKA